jgi:hypothetical protein
MHKHSNEQLAEIPEEKAEKEKRVDETREKREKKARFLRSWAAVELSFMILYCSRFKIKFDLKYFIPQFFVSSDNPGR